MLGAVRDGAQQRDPRAPSSRRRGSTGHEAFIETYFGLWEPHTYTDPDVAPLLRLLRERSIKVGVLSNTVWPRALHERVFRRDGVLELIDGAVYSSEIPWTKPHPEAFLAAMAAIGVSDPSSCVFVGDRPFDDIYGAARLGMRTVFIPHSGLPPYEGSVPDAVISRLAELPALLDQWLDERLELVRDLGCRPAGARHPARGRPWVPLPGGLGDAAGGREQEGRLPARLLGRVLGRAVRVERGRGLLAARRRVPAPTLALACSGTRPGSGSSRPPRSG